MDRRSVRLQRPSHAHTTALYPVVTVFFGVGVDFFRNARHDVALDAVDEKLVDGVVVFKVQIMGGHVVARSVVNVVAQGCFAALVRHDVALRYLVDVPFGIVISQTSNIQQEYQSK